MRVHLTHEIIQLSLLSSLLEELRCIVVEECEKESGLQECESNWDSKHDSPVLFNDELILHCNIV